MDERTRQYWAAAKGVSENEVTEAAVERWVEEITTSDYSNWKEYQETPKTTKSALPRERAIMRAIIDTLTIIGVAFVTYQIPFTISHNATIALIIELVAITITIILQSVIFKKGKPS